jgi:hypothetical protein
MRFSFEKSLNELAKAKKYTTNNMNPLEEED